MVNSQVGVSSVTDSEVPVTKKSTDNDLVLLSRRLKIGIWFWHVLAPYSVLLRGWGPSDSFVYDTDMEGGEVS
jgi:hypothetical protein